MKRAFACVVPALLLSALFASGCRQPALSPGASAAGESAAATTTGYTQRFESVNVESGLRTMDCAVFVTSTGDWERFTPDPATPPVRMTFQIGESWTMDGPVIRTVTGVKKGEVLGAVPVAEAPALPTPDRETLLDDRPVTVKIVEHADGADYLYLVEAGEWYVCFRFETGAGDNRTVAQFDFDLVVGSLSLA